MSAPAQKPRPAPVSTMMPTLSSRSASSRLARTSFSMVAVQALSLSGRFNVMVADSIRDFVDGFLRWHAFRSQAHAQLDLAFGKGRSESQRRAGRSRSVHPDNGSARSNPMHVKCGLTLPRATNGCGKRKQRAHLVVYAGKICPVRDVKSFRREQQVSLLAQFDAARSNARRSRSNWGPDPCRAGLRSGRSLVV